MREMSRTVHYPEFETFAKLAAGARLVPVYRHLPDLAFAFYDRMVVFDNINKTVVVVAMARLDGADPAAAYQAACRRVDEMVAELAAPTAGLAPADIDTAGDSQISYTAN